MAAASVKPNAKSLQQAVRQLAPPLQAKGHKGQQGRMGVIGGSAAYTGAPFFAASTALSMGVDLSTVFCSVEAALAIKSYSPDLMVRPCLFPEHMLDVAAKELKAKQPTAEAVAKCIADEIDEWSGKFGALVIGPGLGKDPLVVQSVGAWMEQAAQRSAEKPQTVVIDGDGIHVLLQHAQLVKKYPAFARALILTPNAAEYHRLAEKFLERDTAMEVDTDCSQWLKDNPEGGEISVDDPLVKETAELARAVGGATVVRKGTVDVVTDGRVCVVVTAKGSSRRVGGQGDMLAGAVGTFATWARIVRESRKEGDKKADEQLPEPVMAAYAAANFCRELQRVSFARHGRSMLASHLLQALPQVLQQWYPEDGVNIASHL